MSNVPSKSSLTSSGSLEKREVNSCAIAPTLSDAIFAIDSIKALKHDARPQYQAFSQKLTLLRQQRNAEAHQSQEASEQEINAAIDIALDMYLYAVGTNITELEMGEATRVQT